MRAINENQRKIVLSLLEKCETIHEMAHKTRIGKSTIGTIAKIPAPNRKLGKVGRPALLSFADKRYCVRKVTAG
jgi:hypothetical protein